MEHASGVKKNSTESFNDKEMYMENCIEVCGMSKNYREFTLDNLSFTLPKGQILGLVGINGSGKTTTIKICAGLVKQSSGVIKYFGEPMRKDNESAILNKIGFVFDNEYTYPNFTGNELIRIIAPSYNNWDTELFSKIARKFRIPLERKISDMSKGTKTKLSIAIAVSHNAGLLILDEPTSGLDPKVRSELNEFILECSKQGSGVIYSSHITSDLEKIVDTILILHDGKMCFYENYHEFLENNVIVRLPYNEINCKIAGEMKHHIVNEDKIIGYCDKTKLTITSAKEAVIVEPTIEDILFLYS